MSNSKSNEKDIGTKVMDLLVMLLEDQTGEKYEYRKVDVQEEKTA